MTSKFLNSKTILKKTKWWYCEPATIPLRVVENYRELEKEAVQLLKQKNKPVERKKGYDKRGDVLQKY